MPEGCGNMRDALKVLQGYGCQVERKFRTGEWLIVTPSGTEHIVSGTRKDTPNFVKSLIRKLSKREDKTMD